MASNEELRQAALRAASNGNGNGNGGKKKTRKKASKKKATKKRATTRRASGGAQLKELEHSVKVIESARKMLERAGVATAPKMRRR